jgi:hypothetical protein
MQKPTDNWKRTRRAALERVQRTVFDPFSPIFGCYLGACVLYLVAFLHFSVFDHGIGLNYFTASLAICAVIAGALVPVLSGSVAVLYYANKKLDRLICE